MDRRIAYRGGSLPGDRVIAALAGGRAMIRERV